MPQILSIRPFIAFTFLFVFTIACSSRETSAVSCASDVEAATQAELVSFHMADLTPGSDPILMIEHGYPIVDEYWAAKIKAAPTRLAKAHLFITAIRSNLQPQPGVVVSSAQENEFDSVNDARQSDWTIGGGGREIPQKDTPENRERYGYDERWWAERLINVRRWLAARRITANWTRLPEVMTFTEVENEAVLRQIANAIGSVAYLRATHGRYERRGINLGVLVNDFEAYKLRGGEYADLKPVFGVPEYRDEIEFQQAGLEAGLELNTRPALVLSFGDGKKIIKVHGSSMRRGPEYRHAIYRTIAKYVERQLQRDPDQTIILMGDFNTNAKDRDSTGHPLDHFLKPDSSVNPHLARNPFLDTRELLSPEMAALLPEGTHYYGREKSWSWLDRILVLRSGTDGRGPLQLVEDSFEAWDLDFLLRNGIPNRFNPDAEPGDWGWSDHLPVSAQFRTRND